jgi:hypothetical protein
MSADFYAEMTAWAALATAIATLLLVLTGAGALIFAWVQINSERAYRRVDNLERELEKFDSGRYASARKALAKNRLADRERYQPMSSDTAPGAAYEILNFFEHLALLAKSGHLEVRAIWHTFGWWILMMNFDLNPLVREERKYNKSVLKDFEWLVNEVSLVEQKEEGKPLEVTPDSLFDFYDEELGADDTISTLKRKSPRRSRTSGARSKT